MKISECWNCFWYSKEKEYYCEVHHIDIAYMFECPEPERLRKYPLGVPQLGD